ncbi:MAG: hypothetical protein HY539_04430 [Deltaproteobacteria bacterium]|nr:hypothetical protein [Deltaproteobacteria bacterium]
MGNNARPVLILTQQANRQCLETAQINGQGSNFTVYQHPDLPGISAVDVREKGTIQCNGDLFIVTNYPNPHLHDICDTTSGWRPASTIRESQMIILASCSPTISLKYPVIGSFLKQGLPLWIGAPVFAASWIGMRRWAESTKNGLGPFFLTRTGIIISLALMVWGATSLWNDTKN